LSFQYACDITAEVVGKPSSAFFRTGLEDMGVSAEQVQHLFYLKLPFHSQLINFLKTFF